MDNLYIEPTRSSPEVNFDDQQCILSINGKSYPENAAKFYEPVLSWIKSYINELNQELTIEIYISYLNTSSSKIFISLFDYLEDEYKKGKGIVIKWYYEEENDIALECGEEFKEDLNLPFMILEKKR
ncbi:MAG: DUF1987 domain-containing protein [Spirochaetes bacterium]|nr:DUF1987 domain-containing protein [Spirochaetota bacterium]